MSAPPELRGPVTLIEESAGQLQLQGHLKEFRVNCLVLEMSIRTLKKAIDAG